MNAPQSPNDDLPAIAAYAVAEAIDPEAAAIEWRFLAEPERGRYRMIAGAAVSVAALHTAPAAALNPPKPPDARALAETYWAANQAVAPGLRGGPLPLACVIRDIQIASTDALKSVEDREPDDDGESEGAEPAYADPPRADPSGHDPHQPPTLAELGGEKFADYPEAGL